MKQCPFCKADIEENARFCLYCMKPLVEKEMIKLPKKRRWIWILVAVVLIVCIGIGVALLSGGEGKLEETQTTHPTGSVKPNPQPSESTADEGTSTGEMWKEDTPSVEMPEETVPSTEPIKEDNPPVQTTNPKVVFSYREVAPGDFFPSDSVTEGSVVITGVKEVSPDGEYEVPAYIDGKPVVGIMSLAFSGSDARRVTLGENILRVNQNAFAGCFDIEVLCIKSKDLFLSRSALIDAAHRSCQLTIYCAADCVVDDDLYGDCYLKDIVRVYGAEYREL